MNKTDMVNAIAKKADLPIRTVDVVVLHFADLVINTLRKGGEVNFTGFGKFTTIKRKARKGVNPKTGAPIKIGSRKVVKFYMGAPLKRLLNPTK